MRNESILSSSRPSPASFGFLYDSGAMNSSPNSWQRCDCMGQLQEKRMLNSRMSLGAVQHLNPGVLRVGSTAGKRLFLHLPSQHCRIPSRNNINHISQIDRKVGGHLQAFETRLGTTRNRRQTRTLTLENNLKATTDLLADLTLSSLLY